MRGCRNRFAFRIAVAFIAVVLSGAAARADMGAPGITRGIVDYQVDFAENFPDQLFVVYRHVTLHQLEPGQEREVAFNADKAEYVDPAPGPVLIAHPFATANPVSFLIVPRAAVGYDQPTVELGKAVLAGRVPGATRYDLPLSAEWPGWRQSRFVIEYQVRRAPGGEPELIRVNWNPLYQCWVVGVGLPVLIAVATVWCFIRRRRRTKLGADRAEPPAAPDTGRL